MTDFIPNREEKLQEAINNWQAAKVAYDAAKSNRARRDAAEDIEFWSSKMAFYTHCIR